MLQSVLRAALVLVACIFSLSFAESNLQQVETEHYIVVFSKGHEYWANRVITIAEEIWADLAVGYDILDEYRKIIIHIVDAGDYANGAAYWTKSFVQIYTTHMDNRQRASGNWIRNVLIHELSHLFSLKAATKNGFFQNFTLKKLSMFENPDVNLSLEYSSLLTPMWWTEGIAQYESYKHQGDLWDSYREMLLRMAVLEDDLLDYVEMSSFNNRNAFYREMIYNQGYSLVNYIGDTYGNDAVRKLGIKKSLLHFNKTLKLACGKNGQALYKDWVKSLRAKYSPVAEEVNKNLKEGSLIFDEGYWDMYGSRSPDGKYIVLTSNKSSDIRDNRLYIIDTEEGKVRKVRKRRIWNSGGSTRSYSNAIGKDFFSPDRNDILTDGYNGPLSLKGTNQSYNDMQRRKERIPSQYESSSTDLSTLRDIGINSRIQWFPDSKRIYYSRYTKNSGSKRDIFIYNIDTKVEKQITWHARALDPALSPDGRTFAYIYNDGGIQNLALIDVDGNNTRYLTNFNDGTQMYNPCWTKDGKQIILNINYLNNRDIAIVNAKAEPFDRQRKVKDSTFFADSLNYQADLELEMLISTPADERDPYLSPDGKLLYFTSDRTGIFNIYRMNLETGDVEQISNVLGGAICPIVDQSGKKLLYTGYHAGNYNVYELDTKPFKNVSLANDTTDTHDFSVRFEDKYLFASDPGNGQYRKGEYKPRSTMWYLAPYISFQPTYITDTVGLSNFRAGFDFLTGKLLSPIGDIYASSYIAKNFKDHTGASWGAELHFRVKDIPSYHAENRDFSPFAEAFVSCDVIRSEVEMLPEFDDVELAKRVPNYSIPWLVGQTEPTELLGLIDFPDTLYIAGYRDDTEGSFRYDRRFINYGLISSLDFNRRHSCRLFYVGSFDHINGSTFDRASRLQTRALDIDTNFYSKETVHDVVDTILSDSLHKFYTVVSDTDFIGVYTFPKMDILNIYDDYLLYKDHNLFFQYSYRNIRPSFSIPDRIDNLLFTAQFVRATYNITDVYSLRDSIIDINDTNSIWLAFDSDNNVSSHVLSATEKNDYFSLNLAWLERFPIPGNNLRAAPPKGLGFRHFLTLNGFFGSLNRRLKEEAYLAPLTYRAAHFLKGYPYFFNPFEPDTLELNVVYYDVWLNYASYSTMKTDSVVDKSFNDILRGNGVMYYNFEYTVGLFHGAGLPIPWLGFVMNGLYVTPFYETANLWNLNWRDFKKSNLFPWKADSFLSDFGLRADLEFTIFDTWNGMLSFTWARRLDLDDVKELRPDGTLKGMDKDRFIFSLNLW